MDMFNQIIKLIPVGLVIFAITQIMALTKNVMKSLAITEFEQILLKKDDYRIDKYLKGVHFYTSTYIITLVFTVMIYCSKMIYNIYEKMDLLAVFIIIFSVVFIVFVYILRRLLFLDENRSQKIKKLFCTLIPFCVFSFYVVISNYIEKAINNPNIILKAMQCIGLESIAMTLTFIAFVWILNDLLEIKSLKQCFKYKGKETEVTTDTYLLRGIDSEKIILMDKEKYYEANYIYIHNMNDDTYNVFQKILI